MQRSIQSIEDTPIVKVYENNSKLWMRFVAKLYRGWKLIASTPANKLSDLDFTFLDKQRWN